MTSVKKIVQGVVMALFWLGLSYRAFADTKGITEVNKLVNNISDFILKPLIFLMFAIATFVFIWGAKDFVGAADNAEARAKGAQQMIWGIIGMVIMVSAIAIKTIVENTVLKL